MAERLKKKKRKKYILYQDTSTSVADHLPVQVYPASHPGAGSAPAPDDPDMING